MLDYGDGDVLVEMDDGDRVKVTGRIDSKFFEGRELEADSIVKLSS